MGFAVNQTGGATMVESCPTEARHFLDYYAAGLDTCSTSFALFTLPDRRTFASRDVAAVADHAASAARAGRDVYFHIHLHDLVEGEHSRRGSTATTRVAIGLYADIDARGPGRKKPSETLCPTVDDSLWVVERFNELYNPIAASLVIGSGHGCYPAVLFREPLVLAGPEDAALLESLSRRYHHALHSIASERGWTGAVDFCDAAKVLRLPGTVNHKDPANPAPVKLIHTDAARFNPSDLDEVLPLAREPKLFMLPGRESEAVTLIPGAQPPFDKFEALRCNEARFARSWEHQRPDLKDQSQSAYDQSLANFAALAAWSDQEIVDLIIANRRKHGASLKLRHDYYQRTIAHARRAAAPFLLDQKIAGLVEADAAEAVSPEEPAPSDPAAKQRALLEMLSARFRVPIHRIVKYTGEPSQYRLETGCGDVQLGGVAGLITQSKLRLSVADATGRYLPHFDSEVWPMIAQALLDACEAVDRGEDATMRGALSEWLRCYLGEKSIHPTLAEADEGREPFAAGDAVYIFSGDLKRWLQMRQNERVTQGKLTADLRAFGAEPEILKAVIHGRATSRSVWKLPAGPWIPERA